MGAGGRQSAYPAKAGISPKSSGWFSARRRLAGFAHTLRDNGFKVGLAETGDALAILAGPLAARSSTLRPAFRALFCATHSDWERFDEIFDAYWLGRSVHQARILAGSAFEGRAPAHVSRMSDLRQERRACRPSERRDDVGDDAGDGRGTREGAARIETSQALTYAI